jgi:transposase
LDAIVSEDRVDAVGHGIQQVLQELPRCPPVRLVDQLVDRELARAIDADVLLDDLAPRIIVLGDKAYDGNAIRNLIERQGAVPNIPSRSTGAGKAAPRVRSKGRNAVERMFCRLKDFRRIATRYDKLAANFLGAIYLAATITWCL